jgi:hypothetical protein
MPAQRPSWIRLSPFPSPNRGDLDGIIMTEYRNSSDVWLDVKAAWLVGASCQYSNHYVVVSSRTFVRRTPSSTKPLRP